jgi:hypothetical protein
MNTESKVDIYNDSKTTTKKKDDIAWRSCCLIVNPHAVAYFSQIFITLIVLAISTYFLVLADGDCNKSSPWINVISFLIGKILSNVYSSA